MKSFLLMLLALIIITIVTLPLIAVSVIRRLLGHGGLDDYFMVVAIGFDQLGGSILYGQEDWTVSSWTYVLAYRENKEAQRFMKIINFIFGENHCEKSYLWESIKQGDVK